MKKPAALRAAGVVFTRGYWRAAAGTTKRPSIAGRLRERERERARASSAARRLSALSRPAIEGLRWKAMR